jgi:O-antigen ligase
MMIIVGQVTLSASSIICAAIMIVVLYLLRNENSKLYSSLWVNIVLGASALFAFFNAILLQLPFVAYIITKVLKKNMYLTARVMIYEKVAELFLQKPLTGYGFGTSYDVWMDAYGFQNTQNGLLDWVEQAGIIAPALIMVIICFALKEYKGSKCRNIQTKGMLAVLYTLSFMASIEICLNTQFFCVVVLIYAMNEVLKDRIDNKQ